MKNISSFEQFKLFEDFNALHSASVKGIPSIIRNLVKTIDVNSGDKDNITPLMYACKYGKEQAVITLVKAGADINLDDHRGTTPLYYACESGNYNIVKFLIDNGANVKAIKGAFKEDIMQAAINGGNPDIVKLLLSKNLKITKENARYAFNTDEPTNTAMLEFIIEQGFDISKIKEIDYQLKDGSNKDKYRNILSKLSVQEKIAEYSPSTINWLISNKLLNKSIAKKYPHILSGADLGLLN